MFEKLKKLIAPDVSRQVVCPSCKREEIVQVPKFRGEAQIIVCDCGYEFPVSRGVRCYQVCRYEERRKELAARLRRQHEDDLAWAENPETERQIRRMKRELERLYRNRQVGYSQLGICEQRASALSNIEHGNTWGGLTGALVSLGAACELNSVDGTVDRISESIDEIDRQIDARERLIEKYEGLLDELDDMR